MRVPFAFKIAAIFSLVVSVTLAIRYSGQHLLELHAFRQTQTALTSYWLWRDGFRLAYETPAAGAPWSIPFEFPIYEWLAALLSFPFGFRLEPVGRLLSYAFLLACLWPVSRILRYFCPQQWRLQFAIFVPLFLLSPQYLFWGRSFTIETAALFFTLMAAQVSLPLIEGAGNWRDASLAFVFFTFAFLQKSTTILPVWLILIATVALRQNGRGLVWLNASIRRVLDWKIVAGFLLPFAIAYAWVRFTDDVKLQNLAGHRLTSAGLADWNFGPLRMRFSFGLWYHVVWNRMFVRNVGGPIGFALLAVAAVCSSRRERLLIYASLGAFVLPILIFENLHFVHDYYQTANMIYLLLAVAVALAGLWLQFPRSRFLLLLSFAGILAINAIAFVRWGYAAAERIQFTTSNSQTLRLAEYLKANTPETAPLIIFGLDWSGELPFYSERRALGVPNWFTPAQQNDIIVNPSRYVGEQPSAFVFCGHDYDRLRSVVMPNSLPAEYGSSDCEVKIVPRL